MDLGGDDDTVEVHDLTASVRGGSGADRIRIPSGVASGDAGADTLLAAESPPRSTDLHGGNGADRLEGHRWSHLDGGAGPDAFSGGGIVHYSGRTSGVSVTFDGRADDGHPGAGDNVPSGLRVAGTPYADVFEGGPAADDDVTGLGGDDVFRGGSGDDSFASWPGAAWGGPGNDVLMTGTARGEDGADHLRAATAFGGRGDDLVEGRFWGDDRLYGESGADVVLGDHGSDLLDGGDGDDRLVGNPPEAARNAYRDVVVGGAGNDVLVEHAAYVGTGTGAGDTYDGGAGTDLIDYGQRAVRLAVSHDGARNDGEDADGDGIAEEGDNVAATVEVLLGGSASDRLTATGPFGATVRAGWATTRSPSRTGTRTRASAAPGPTRSWPTRLTRPWAARPSGTERRDAGPSATPRGPALSPPRARRRLRRARRSAAAPRGRR